MKNQKELRLTRPLQYAQLEATFATTKITRGFNLLFCCRDHEPFFKLSLTSPLMLQTCNDKSVMYCNKGRGQTIQNINTNLVSSQTRIFSQPSGGSLWKQQLLLGPGEEEISRGGGASVSFWEENGDRGHISALSTNSENRKQKSVKTVLSPC